MRGDVVELVELLQFQIGHRQARQPAASLVGADKDVFAGPAHADPVEALGAVEFVKAGHLVGLAVPREDVSQPVVVVFALEAQRPKPHVPRRFALVLAGDAVEVLLGLEDRSDARVGGEVLDRLGLAGLEVDRDDPKAVDAPQPVGINGVPPRLLQSELADEVLLAVVGQRRGLEDVQLAGGHIGQDDARLVPVERVESRILVAPAGRPGHPRQLRAEARIHESLARLWNGAGNQRMQRVLAGERVRNSHETIRGLSRRRDHCDQQGRQDRDAPLHGRLIPSWLLQTPRPARRRSRPPARR